MKVNTKYFGVADIDDNKVIVFKEGLIGFEEFTQYAILHNEEDKEPLIQWIQSVEEPLLAIPVIDPFLVKSDYNPMVNNETENAFFENMQQEDLLVLVTLVVPSELKNMTVNLKAPIVINTKTKEAHQVIVENSDYEIKYKIYDVLKGTEEKVGE